jgi:hypothetical protein
MVSSPAPSISSVGTLKLLGTTALPRLAFRGPDSSSPLGDSHVGGSPGSGSSSSSHTSDTSHSYATPRTPSRLGRIPEMPTGSSATSLVRSIPGARPKSSRFPAPKSSATSTPYLTAEDKENSQDTSSDSYITASERTLTKSTYSAGSATSEPLSFTQEAATTELACSETEVPPSDIASMHTNGSDEEDIQFDPQGAARLSRVDSYYATTSAGLARAGSIAGESTYSTIAYDVCFDTDISASTEPRSVRSVTPTPAPSTPYHSAPEPTSTQSMSSIPTIRTEESQYATPDRVDSSTEYSSAMRWPSSTEYATVPLAASPAQSSSLSPLPSFYPPSTRVSSPSASTPIVRSCRGTLIPSVVGAISDTVSEMSVTSAVLSPESSATPTQSRITSLASRPLTAGPISTPRRPSPQSISSKSLASRQPKSTTMSSVSSLTTTTASSV